MKKIAASIFVALLFLSMLAFAQSMPVGDYTKTAVQGDFVAHDFKFHTGQTLKDLRLHYATWGTPHRGASGQIDNAVLLLHGTLGNGLGWGKPSPGAPNGNALLGPGGPFDVEKYFVIAPDTIGAGKSLRPSDGMRMQFPRYNIEDIVAAERLVVEHLGVKHLVAVSGFSMGGRQTWQWGVQYPEFMDVLVPLGSSPFPLIGRRSNIDFLVEAIIKADPTWNNGNYQQNPPAARLADLMYVQFLHGPRWFDRELPTRADSRQWVATTGHGHFNAPDANDFIYMMEVNNDYDPWAQIERIRCPVLMINNSGDQMHPVELEHAEKVTSRMRNVSYVEVKDDAEDGHLALMAKVAVWAPKVSEWLSDARHAQQSPPASDQVTRIEAMVKKAAALVESEGKAAFSEFRKRNGEWWFGNSYLFIYDKDFNVLLNPAFPQREGTNVHGQKDVNGKLFHDEFMKTVLSKGAGWVDYMFPKPGQTQPSQKWSYVKAVKIEGGTGLIGAGFYSE